jgi:hypothetical protein
MNKSKRKGRSRKQMRYRGQGKWEKLLEKR